MVIKGDRNLNQALQKLLLRSGRGSPDVLQRLMGVKKLPVIEQFQPVSKVVGKHKRHCDTGIFWG